MLFKRSKLLLGMSLSLAILSGCVSSGARFPNGVEESLYQAEAYEGGEHGFFAQLQQSANNRPPRPTVIYLHGCTGVTGHDRSWAKRISEMGFTVILPNSFVRPNRVSNCDGPQRSITGRFPSAYEYREQEIRFTVQYLLEKGLADEKSLFLMGHSEGGYAVALTHEKRLRGLIISGWTCTHRTSPQSSGIRAPRDLPVLALSSRRDPWYKNTVWDGSCSDFARFRNNFHAFEIAGATHDTDSRDAQKAVAEFLGRYSIK
jgi:dienelactone hydrolase